MVVDFVFVKLVLFKLALFLKAAAIICFSIAQIIAVFC